LLPLPVGSFMVKESCAQVLPVIKCIAVTRPYMCFVVVLVL
jgi:hypothetical protein